MSYHQDKTVKDNNRRLLNLQRSEIQNALPEYFAGDFPNLIKLFEAYYEWMEKEGNPSEQIHKLFQNRDTTQVPEGLLQYLEDELLLGQAYFGGFINKREAVKFSNLLYRSKGTKYSIEQFFRGFYGTDPQVIYPKENIFKIGPDIDYDLDSINTASQQIKTEASKLGPESQRYITDDARYQVLSVLIKSDIPITTWLDTYKLFVHPAGAHIAGELVLELVNGNVIRSVRESGAGIPIEATFSTEAVAFGNFGVSNEDLTLIETGDGSIGMLRTQARLHYDEVQTTTYDSISALTLREVLSPNSFTMDNTNTGGIITLDQDSTGTSPLTLSTFDEGIYRTLFDSENSADSAHYPFQHV